MNEPEKTAAEMQAIRDVATDWLVLRDAGFSPEARDAFDAWVGTDPVRAKVFSEIEAAWGVVTRPGNRGYGGKLLAELERRATKRRRRQRTRWSWGLAMVGAAAAVSFLAIPREAAEPSQVVIEPVRVASIIKPERHLLEDGSQVELRAGAEIEIDYSSVERSVRLLHGTAHFTVTTDPKRPFRVTAGTATVEAIGTEFVVSFAAHKLDVLVTRGLVQVGQAGPTLPRATPILLGAGDRVTMGLEESDVPVLEVLSVAELAGELAWREQRLEFSGMPLKEIVVLMNGLNRTKLVLEDESLEELRVSGIYWIGDPAGFAHLVATSFGLRVESHTDRVLIRR